MRNKKKYILLTMMISFIIVSLLLIESSFTIHSVTGTSMEPTISKKDMVLVNKNKKVERYAIVAFSGKKKMYVKRVIGIPGDRFIIQGQELIFSLNKCSNFKNNIRIKVSPQVAEKFKGYSKIPKGFYFVIGDHIDVSKDSRIYGFISEKEIEGVIKYILK